MWSFHAHDALWFCSLTSIFLCLQMSPQKKKTAQTPWLQRWMRYTQSWVQSRATTWQSAVTTSTAAQFLRWFWSGWHKARPGTISECARRWEGAWWLKTSVTGSESAVPTPWSSACTWQVCSSRTVASTAASSPQIPACRSPQCCSLCPFQVLKQGGMH